MSEDQKEKLEKGTMEKPEKKKIKEETKTCQIKTCGKEYLVNEKYTQEKFCPVCICAAQTNMIKTYHEQFQAIREAMGDDFMKNLLVDIANKKLPKEITLADGQKGFVFDPKLFQVAVNKGSRSDRRNHEKKKRKDRKSSK